MNESIEAINLDDPNRIQVRFSKGTSAEIINPVMLAIRAKHFAEPWLLEEPDPEPEEKPALRRRRCY